MTCPPNAKTFGSEKTIWTTASDDGRRCILTDTPCAIRVHHDDPATIQVLGLTFTFRKSHSLTVPSRYPLPKRLKLALPREWRDSGLLLRLRYPNCRHA